MDIAPLARLEFTQLLDVQTQDQAIRWALRNSRRARRREQHVMHLVVDAAADKVRDGSTFYRLEYAPDAAETSVLCGRLVTAAANGDEATVAALVQVWAQLDETPRRETLVELIGMLIGGRIT